MKIILPLFGIGLALSVRTASGQTIITNANAPALTVPGVGVQTFTSTPQGNYLSLNLGAITFSGPSGVRVENLYAGQFNATGNYLNNNNGTNSLLTLTFGTPMAAFGFNYGASDDPWTLSAFDAGNNLIASTTVAPIGGSSNGEFIGIASPTANIAYATFKDDGGMWFPDWVLIDNVKYTEVPLVTNSAALDCNCLANLPGLQTNGCPAYVPDLCALGIACFSTNMLPGSCLQNPPAGSLAGPGTNNISVMVMDTQSNMVFCQVAFIVIPPPNPTLSLTCSPAKTVSCGSGWMFDDPIVNTTCCDPFMTVNVLSETTNGTCPQIITRTWQVTNSCGLSADCSQTVTVVDTNPPVTLCSGVNLVPNGDFEYHTACPNNGGQIALAAPWFAATDGTCDYNHSCASIPQVSTPSNAVGNQVPLSGQGYAGIFVYGPDVNVPGSSYREYIEVPLLASLVAGQTYRVSFYVSRAENYAAAVAEVGAHFSPGPIISNGYNQVLNFVPQVVNPSTNLLLSTTAWMLVQGTFVAAGGESYMTLGNFLADTNTTAVPASGIYTNFSYLYVEDVSVVPLCAGTVTNKTVQCDETWTFDPPTPFDQCSGTNVAVTVASTVTNGVCPKVITRTWLLVDLCGNTNTWSQTVTVVDNTPPAIAPCAAPNLVPNPGFESYTSCPTNPSNLGEAAPWYAPTDGTADFFNACAAFGSGASVPTNFPGVQNAFSGQGYAGAFLYQPGGANETNSYREYLQTPLLAPLVAGQSYTVSFYVNRSDNHGWAIAEIGAHLSVGPVTNYVGPGGFVLPVVPQVENPSANLLTSTNSWMLVQGAFTAAGGENYLTLGNFRSDANTTAVLGSGIYNIYAYYYFDEVSVVANCAATNKVVPCGAPIIFDTPAGVDLCSGTNVTVSVVSTVTNGVCPLSVTRTWALTDLCANTNLWSQTVSVTNSSPLAVNCACLQDSALALLTTNACVGVVPDLSMLTNSPCITGGGCGTRTLTQSPAAGTIVGAGINNITVNIFNCGGVTNTCVLPFYVNAPALSLACPPNLTLLSCGTSAVGWFNVTATGNTGPVVCSPPSGSTFPLGNTTVTCTATNNCGGVATCSFTVNVRPYLTRWGCVIIAIGIPTTPLGSALVTYLPVLPGGGLGVDFDNLGSSGQDGVRFDFGPAQKFTFSTVLDFGAPEGAGFALALPPAPGQTTGTPLVSFYASCKPRCGWDIKVNRPGVVDDTASYRSIALGTNGELYSSFTQDGATLATNILANLSPMGGATSAVMTVTLDCLTRELTFDFPQCTWTPDSARKGWDGCIYGNGPRGSKTNKTARLILTPLTTVPFPPVTTLDLLASNLTQVAFDNPSITASGKKWGDGHVTLMKAYDDGTEQGLEFAAAGDGGGVSTDLGYAGSFQFRMGHFETGDIPTEEQIFSIRGWPPGTTTNRPPPPPIFSLRLAPSAGGAGIDCSADFTQWGASNVTVQLWNGGALVSENTHVPATLDSPLVTLGGFPGVLGCPGVGVLSLSDTNPLVVLSGLDCSSTGCIGTELRILPELTAGSTLPAAFAALQCLISDGMDDLISGLQTTPAATPIPLHATSTPDGISFSWEGDGLHLQGAETVAGPWYDLSLSSPATLSTSHLARFFRLAGD